MEHRYQRNRMARLVLRVADSGKGIKPEFLPHIFYRFSQEDSSTNRKYMGLGLGLAIVHKIIELHGGTISAESAGEGTDQAAAAHRRGV